MDLKKVELDSIEKYAKEIMEVQPRKSNSEQNAFNMTFRKTAIVLNKTKSWITSYALLYNLN